MHENVTGNLFILPLSSGLELCTQNLKQRILRGQALKHEISRRFHTPKTFSCEKKTFLTAPCCMRCFTFLCRRVLGLRKSTTDSSAYQKLFCKLHKHSLLLMFFCLMSDGKGQENISVVTHWHIHVVVANFTIIA